MKIQEIQIKGLFGKKDITWQLNPQVNVLVGVNGSGKSTILSILYCILKDSTNSKSNKIFNSAEILFPGNKSIIRHNDTVSTNNLISTISEKIEKEVSKNFSQHINNLKDENEKNMLLKNFESYIKNEIISNIQEHLLKDINGIDGDTELLIEQTKHILIDKEIYKKINTTMISTINLSANAIFEFKGSNKEVLNILDLEMDKIINQFNKNKDNKIEKILIDTINFFLNSINKYVSYRDNTIIYFDKDIKKELRFSDLSSGERQLIYILMQVALNSTEKNKNSIILMDEPEISLHLDWQEYFIKQLTLLNPNAQFIIVTHSPALIMNGWNDIYTDMEEITTWL